MKCQIEFKLNISISSHEPTTPLSALTIVGTRTRGVVLEAGAIFPGPVVEAAAVAADALPVSGTEFAVVPGSSDNPYYSPSIPEAARLMHFWGPFP